VKPKYVRGNTAAFIYRKLTGSVLAVVDRQMPGEDTVVERVGS
jgi:hypothetical protein